ncbi:putative 4-hydroxy-4-methyl-2-oxoglutarate aldolase [Capsicum annuum]|nr:putative 4-hydroxy-4-methyl-2-oxoglutarate aldolase [Capsicum annuum]
MAMTSLATSDVCDANAKLLSNGDLRMLPPIFNIYGQRRAFSGPIVTVKVFEDNVLVKEVLKTGGEGRVLVVDGGGSMGCAILGGKLAQLGHDMGWVGVVVNGCIRDVDEISRCDIGIRALASVPRRPSKNGYGEKHIPVYIRGTLIRDGEWLYADSDGILISKTQLSI